MNKTTNELIEEQMKLFRKNFVPIQSGYVGIRLPSEYHDRVAYKALQDYIRQSLHQVQEATRSEVIEELKNIIQAQRSYQPTGVLTNIEYISMSSLLYRLDNLKASEKETEKEK